MSLSLIGDFGSSCSALVCPFSSFRQLSIFWMEEEASGMDKAVVFVLGRRIEKGIRQQMLQRVAG